MTNNFEIWKSNPQNYFVRHRGLFVSIIHQCYFAGHADKKQMQQVEADLQHGMVMEPVAKRLLAYQGMTDFLLFYAKILKNVIVEYSQDEDLRLLTADFRLLILKYNPLIEKLVNEHIRIMPVYEPEREDTIQQIFENLLRKRETILNQFVPEMNFRNYVWKIIKNECINLLQTESRYHHRFGLLTPGCSEIADPSVLYENLVYDEMFRVFDQIIASYIISKNKLVVCLKVLLSTRISVKDLQSLFTNGCEGYSAEELAVISAKLNFGGENLRGIFTRMSQIRPVLNLAEKSHTDGQSYWRWTNQQVTHLTHFLNETHGMNFDRETLKILAEKYFENYYDK